MKDYSRVLAVAILTASIASCAYYADGRESRAIAVGIDAYAYVNDLGACVSDARAIAQAVAVDTSLAITGEAKAPTVTKAMVLKAISEAASAAPSDGYETFIFHYSGHGDDADGGVLVMGDATVKLASDTVITVDELLSAIAAVRASVRVVILDSCYSGLFVDEGSGVSTLPGDGDYSLTSLIAEAASRYDEAAEGDLIVMSAAGAAELSQEYSDHGYFSAGLLQSVAHGDENDDGLVTLTEAFGYASRYVEDVFNAKYPYYSYYPRISGSPLDIVLFKTGSD
jgi:uncharacterized caspase-like protein